MSNIYFRCSCQKNLAVDESASGETINCPECGNSIEIPEPAIRWRCSCNEDLSAGSEMAGQTVMCVNCGENTSVPSSRIRFKKLGRPYVDDDSTTSDSLRSCPSCGKTVKQDSVICINCGLNLQTGKRIKTRFGASGGRFKKRLVFLISAAAVAGMGWGCLRFYLPMVLSSRLALYQSHVKDGRFRDAAMMLEPGRFEAYLDHVVSGAGDARIRNALMTLKFATFSAYLDRSVPEADRARLGLSSVCPACGGKAPGDISALLRCAECAGKGRITIGCGRCVCADCGGSGSCSGCGGSGRTRCDVCKGSGMGGTTMTERECPQCRGKGSVALIRGSERCRNCGGSGRISVETRAMCDACGGKRNVPCPACGGSGKCPVCNGLGRTDECRHCGGTGIERTDNCTACQCAECANMGIVGVYNLPVRSSWINDMRGYIFFDSAKSDIADRSDEPGRHRLEYQDKLFFIDVHESELICISTEYDSFEWVRPVVFENRR